MLIICSYEMLCVLRHCSQCWRIHREDCSVKLTAIALTDRVRGIFCETCPDIDMKRILGLREDQDPYFSVQGYDTVVSGSWLPATSYWIQRRAVFIVRQLKATAFNQLGFDTAAVHEPNTLPLGPNLFLILDYTRSIFYFKNIVWHFSPLLRRACGRSDEWAAFIW
jgi:hypothetical protein